MGLAEPSILAGRLHGRGGLNRFAERLHGDARRRRDMLVLRRRRRFRFRIFLRVVDHLPTSLILPLSGSGYWVAVASPFEYLPSTVERRVV